MLPHPDFQDPNWPKYGRPPEPPPGRTVTELPAPGPEFWRGLRNAAILLLVAVVVGALFGLWW